MSTEFHLKDSVIFFLFCKFLVEVYEKHHLEVYALQSCICFSTDLTTRLEKISLKIFFGHPGGIIPQDGILFFIENDF